jgi:hypothetical protein
LDVDRRNGKIVRHWRITDELKFLKQIVTQWPSSRHRASARRRIHEG